MDFKKGCKNILLLKFFKKKKVLVSEKFDSCDLILEFLAEFNRPASSLIVIFMQ